MNLRSPRLEGAKHDRTEAGAPALQPLAPEVRVGTRLAGYALERIVGKGGMGVVYKATHLHLARTAAVKVLIPELAAAPDFRERFLRESRTAAALHHPNIVTVYDAGEADGLLYIAMQYVDGTDLAALLEREGALAPDRALEIVGQMGEALDAAHALGLVHRDVKPGNVLLDAQRCYLTDFGLTRSVSSKTALTVHGQFVGTIDYMPPEQIQGGSLDRRADVYALGCLLYHTLVGAAPFESDSQVSVMYAHMHHPPPPLGSKTPLGPGPLDAVVAKAMAKRREDRYDTCGDFISALCDALAGKSSPPAPDAVAPAPSSARTVLVAARDPSVRAMIRVALGAGQFRVVDAVDAQAATALARQDPPDLAVLDTELDGAGGEELGELLRSGAQGRTAAILGLVSRAHDRGAAAETTLNADDYITKPFSALQLQHKLADLLGADALEH